MSLVTADLIASSHSAVCRRIGEYSIYLADCTLGYVLCHRIGEQSICFRQTCDFPIVYVFNMWNLYFIFYFPLGYVFNMCNCLKKTNFPLSYVFNMWTN